MTSTHNYDEQKKKLRLIEEEKESLEKLKKQIKDEEEETARQTFHSIQKLNNSIDRWRDDPTLQKIFHEQQELLAIIQSNRSQFNEDFDKHMRSYNKQLAEQEEGCRQELRRIEQKDEKEENKENGNKN